MANVYLTKKEIEAIGAMIEDVRGLLDGAGDDYINCTAPLVRLADSAYSKMLKASGKQ